MPATSFRKFKQLAQSRLSLLSPNLTYHSIDHTMDVLKQCVRIAGFEQVTGHQLDLLKIAALYHDTGFLFAYTGHEEKSCDIFLEDIKGLDINSKDVKTILGIIMSTKVPQKPKTLPQRIICDADLDYLGRRDFPLITERLKHEFLKYSIVQDEKEWKKVQRDFLKKHRYHTPSSRERREPVKQRNFSLLD